MFLYVMVLTYALTEDTPYADWKESVIWFPNYQTCIDAMDVMYDAVYEHYPNSIGRCIETDFPRGGILRPKIRPKTLQPNQS